MNHNYTTFLAILLLAGLPACCGGKRNKQTQTTKTTADANALQVIEVNPAPAAATEDIQTNIADQAYAQSVETAVETTLAAVPTNIAKF